MHPRRLLGALPGLRNVVDDRFGGHSVSKLRIPLTLGDIAKRVFLGKPLITEELAVERLSNPVALGRTFAGCDLVDRLWHRADLDRTVAARRAGRLCVAASHHRRHPVDPGVGGRVVSAGRHGLHPGGRVLHRRAGELRAAGRAGRRCGAVDRLCGHGGGAVRGRARSRWCRRCLRWVRTAWKSRSVWSSSSATRTCAECGKRAAVRGRDLLLRRHDRHDDRGRCCPPYLLGFADLRSAAHVRDGACSSREWIGDGRDDPGAAARVRQRRFVADWSRGDLQYRRRFPEAAGPQRASGADRDGLHPRFPAGGCRLPGVRHPCHAVPEPNIPSVLSQIARAVFGTGVVGNVFFILVQASTAAILFTGANTSFNGFPALASFVAEDRFLPRQLMKRGHRLVFSNGIIALTALSVVLLIATGGSVNALVPFYAIGVFTGFSMAGYGMTKHHLTHREPGWRHRLAINLSAGILSTVVVGIFAVAKFTEGAWLVVVVFPLLVFLLIRLNQEYRAEAAILEMFRTDRPELVKYARHQVFVFVNSVDLAVIEALRYGKGLRADELIAVHFMVDATHAAQLRKRWDHFDLDTRAAGGGLPGPAGHPGRAAAGCQGAQGTSGHQRDGAVATSDLCAAAGTPAARPHRGQDRPGRQPHPGRGGDDRALRRAIADQGGIPRARSSNGSRAKSTSSKRGFPRLRTGRRRLRAPRAAVVGDHGGGPDPRTARDLRRTGQRSRGHHQRRRTFRWIVVGDDSGEISITFRPGHGGADIQPGQLLRITGKPRQSGNRPMSMVDPAYRVIEEPGEGRRPGDSEDSGRLI